MLQELLQLPVVTLLRVLAGIVVAFVVLPAIVLPRPRSAITGLDAVVVRAVRWLGITLVTIHLLAAIRLFHVLPIVLLCAAGVLLRRRAQADPRAPQPAHRGSLLQRVWLVFVDALTAVERAGIGAVTARVRPLPGRAVRAVSRLASRRTAVALAFAAPILVVLTASLALRSVDAFRYQTLTPSEAYVFLTWAKSVAANNLFVDGIYPYGLPAFIAFLGKTTAGTDLYEIVRYTGPLIGVLLVFGVFYAVLRLTANAGAALFASGAFGLLGTIAHWHAPWIRQTGPMPQELGLAVLLLALPSAVLAVTERNRDHLVTVGLAAVALGLIHPVALGLYLALALAGAGLAAVYARPRELGPAVTVGLVALVAGLASQVYIPLAGLLGAERFRGMDQPLVAASTAGTVERALQSGLGTNVLGHNPLSLLAGAGVVLGLVAAGWLVRRPQTHHLGLHLAGLSGMGLLAFAVYDVRWLPLPVNLTSSIGNLAGILLSLALGAGLAAVTVTVLHNREAMTRAGGSMLAAALALALLTAGFTVGPRERAPSEYEAAAAVTRTIMKSQDAFSYTIVGTPQQRQAIVGIGAFIELWVFARDVTVRDARDPGIVVPDVSSLLFARSLGETLPVPTVDIYVFVEKVPFPVTELAPVGPAEEYYHDRDKRGRIMAAVYAWAEHYRHFRSDMDVYYEDDEIVVYQIRRRPNPVAVAASPQFKDYSWHPGALFTQGPADPSEVVIPWRG